MAKALTLDAWPKVCRAWRVWGDAARVTGTVGAPATALTTPARLSSVPAEGRARALRGSAARTELGGEVGVDPTGVWMGSSQAKRSFFVSAGAVEYTRWVVSEPMTSPVRVSTNWSRTGYTPPLATLQVAQGGDEAPEGRASRRRPRRRAVDRDRNRDVHATAECRGERAPRHRVERGVKRAFPLGPDLVRVSSNPEGVPRQG